MTQIGTPLSEALGGTDITLASSSGSYFTAPVLQATGFDVKQDMQAPLPQAPAAGLSSLVMNNNSRLPTPGR